MLASRLQLPQINFSSFGKLTFALKEVFLLLWKIDRKLFVRLMLLNVFEGTLVFPTIYLEKKILDGIVTNIGNPFWQSAVMAIGVLVGARFVLFVMGDWVRRLVGLYNYLYSWKFSSKMDIILGNKFTSLDLATIEDPIFKDRFHKVERESGRRAWGLAGSFYQIPNNVFGILSAMAILVFFQPLVVVVLVGFVIPSLLVETRMSKLDYQLETKNSTKNRLWGWISYYLVRPRGYMEIRLLKLRRFFSERLEKIQDAMYEDRKTLRFKRNANTFAVIIPQQVFSSILTVYFAALVILGRLSVGTAQAYIRALDSFRTNLMGLVRSVVEIFESYLYITDLIWFMGLSPDIDESKGVGYPKKLDRGIEFDHVWFRYTPKSPWILKDINFKVDPTENLAIVGYNGAGKTTLIKLLCRFYDPQRGRVLIDGKDIKAYKRDEVWDGLSVLFQEFETYPFTARESIGYGDIEKVNDLGLIRNYARKTGIDDFIMDLPKKYENPVSTEFEEGVAPSFGQMQRLAISRSLMKKSNVLILDEPTSNVDPQAEEKIFNEVLTLGKEKILIFISHRFSTVRRADKIISLDKGSVSEMGSHETLMKKKGKYWKLFNLQAKSYS